MDDFEFSSIDADLMEKVWWGIQYELESQMDCHEETEEDPR